MKKLIVTATVLMLLWPRPSYACDSFLCLGDILGITDAGNQAQAIGDRDADRREAEAKIQSERDRDLARIQAEGNERLELARSAGLVNLADTQGKYDVMRTSIEALRDVKLMQLYGDYRIAEKMVDAQPRPSQWPSNLLLGLLLIIAIIATIKLLRTPSAMPFTRPVYRPQPAGKAPKRVPETAIRVIDYPIRVYKEEEL